MTPTSLTLITGTLTALMAISGCSSLQTIDRPRTPSSFSVQGNNYNLLSTEEHSIRMLDDGPEALKVRLDLIANAQSSIDLEYFEFRADQSGLLILKTLINKKRQMASQGKPFRVRILLDKSLQNTIFSPFHAAVLAEEGIETRVYNPRFGLSMTYRNHRKLFLTDTELVSGGRNIADSYFGMDPRHNFSDRDVWIRGPIIEVVRATFEDFWSSRVVRAYELPSNLNRRRLQKRIQEAHEEIFRADLSGNLTRRIHEIGSALLEQEPIFNTRQLAFFSDGPDRRVPAPKVGEIAYTWIRHTRSDLTIENGYIIPRKEEQESLFGLLERDVKIRLVINNRSGSSSEFVATVLSQWHVRELARQGADITLYRGDAPDLKITDNDEATWHTHAKTMVMDQKNSWIGSMNFDPRSINRVNAELAFLVQDNPAFAAHVLASIERRVATSPTMLPDQDNPTERRRGLRMLMVYLGSLFIGQY